MKRRATTNSGGFTPTGWNRPGGIGPAPIGKDSWPSSRSRLILTQFDYYRRYQPLLAQLKTRPGLAQLQIVNTAKLPAPDSIRPLQKVLQHISWAPVVVRVSWE